MLRKMAFVIALLIAPVMVFAAAGEIGKSDWAYQDIKSLVDSGIITKPLEKDTLTRAEAVEYINNGVNNVLYADAASSAGGADLSGKINQLYNLVKAYMEDMMKANQKLDDILNTIGDLAAKKKELEAKQDKLLNAMGMRINGESSMYMTDMLKFGSNYIATPKPPDRYRPITQYIDLKFSLQARKDIYAEATFRMENMFGGFWGSKDIYGLKRFFIQGDMPVSFVFGDYQAKLTPFTLWAVDDEMPFEAKLFADKRTMNKNELNLIDNAWPVNGGKVATIVELFDSMDLNLSVQGARLGEYNKPAYGKYNIGTGAYTEGGNPPHDQYMLAAKASSDFGVRDMLEIGINYTEIIDAKDTGNKTAPVYNNYVVSEDLKFNYNFDETSGIKIYGEYAGSWYTPNKGKSWAMWYYDGATGAFSNTKTTHQYATGSALKAGIEGRAFNTVLDLNFRNVGNSFTANAAQTRIYNFAENYPYISQNNTWNVNPGANLNPHYTIGGGYYPFTRYNPRIVTSTAGIASREGNLLSYPVYDNAASPYGDSTPNRSGIKLSVKGDYLDGMIAPMIGFETLSEPEPLIKSKPRNFTVIQAGAKLQYMPVMVHGGITMQNIKNDASGNSQVAFDSRTIDLGLEWQVIEKKLLAYAGFKSTTMKGTEVYRSTTAMSPGLYPLAQVRFDHTITTMGGGLEFRIAKPVSIGIYFTDTLIEDNAEVKDADDFAYYGRAIGTKMKNYNSYKVQELGAKLSILF